MPRELTATQTASEYSLERMKDLTIAALLKSPLNELTRGAVEILLARANT
jgi:hypothetical protein